MRHRWISPKTICVFSNSNHLHLQTEAIHICQNVRVSTPAFAFKNQLVKEQQEKRFEVERVTLMKNFGNDLSSMINSQKKQVDKCEQQQHEELKVSSKRIRNEQEKELKGFRESLKQEVGGMKSTFCT